MNSFVFCIAFNFLSISNKIDIYDYQLSNLCQNADELINISQQNNIDPFVYASLIYYESRWTPNLKSPKGACGLSQVIPKYVKGVNCKDLMDPKISLKIGAKALSYWKKHSKGSISKALKCYSTGYKCNYGAYSKRIMSLSKKVKKQYKIIKQRISEYE
jgi:soluble lytic murein transglycosylase-like protein